MTNANVEKKQKEKPAESEVERVRHSLFTDTCSAQTTIWDICPMIIHDYIFRLGLDKGADATIVIFEGTCIRGGGQMSYIPDGSLARFVCLLTLI